MNRSDQIKILCVRCGITVAALSRMIDESPQNFSTKLKRNTVTDSEIESICQKLNVQYHSYFELENGEKIE